MLDWIKKTVSISLLIGERVKILSFRLSLSLSVCLSVCLSIMCVYIYMCVSVCVCLCLCEYVASSFLSRCSEAAVCRFFYSQTWKPGAIGVKRKEKNNCKMLTRQMIRYQKRGKKERKLDYVLQIRLRNHNQLGLSFAHVPYLFENYFDVGYKTKKKKNYPSLKTRE